MKYILLFLCFFPLTVVSQNLLLWNGEDSTDANCTYDWAARVNNNAFAGNYCFKGNPDYWHAPGLRLNCRNTWRANLHDYDELWLYAKSSVANKPIRIGFYSWPNVSKGVNVDPYIVGGGGITTSYKLIKIPLDSFKTAQYTLGSIEILYFGASIPPSPTYNIYVDEIWAMDLKPTFIKNHQILSHNSLRLQIAHRYDTTDVKNLTHYQLSSNSDSDFFIPQNATKVGMHYYVEDYDPADHYNNPIPKLNHYLYPIFGASMKNGHTYTLTVTNVKDAANNDFPVPQTFTFTYQDAQYINGTVKANHVGYTPNSEKYGYIGNWLGSASAMEIDHLTPPTFEIRNANTHAVVYTGTSQLRQSLANCSCGANDPNYDLRWSGEKVFSCDFSSLTTAGKYYLYAPKYGRSYPFKIDTTVYDSVFYHCMRGLYYQRCGMDLVPPFADARFQHTACHTPDATTHHTDSLSNLYNNEPLNTVVPMPHGWHDAGDYGKYIPSATQALHDLFTAYEMFPQKFDDSFLDLPESGNGVPDILDEIKWEIDWIREMQTPDGGVYFKVTTTNWPTGMPQNDLATRWIAEKTTFSTAHFCALMAASARNFQPYFPIYADTCLAKARRAWDFLVAHPTPEPPNGYDNRPGIGGGEYSDPLGDVDERAWAAAELYKTTGEAQYHTAFVFYWTQNNPNFGWNNFQHHQLKASWAYCTTTFPTNPTYVNAYKTSLYNGVVNYTIPRLNQSAYRCSYRSEVIPWIAWGSWAHSSIYAWIMITANYLCNTNSLTKARVNFDVQLGNNPQNRSYITGIGFDYPMDPLHHPSQADGQVEPVPGLPVFGPHDYLGYLGYGGATQNPKNLYPKGNGSCMPYPTLRRYYDVFENVAMSEFGVEAMVKISVSLARFTSMQTVTPLPVSYLSIAGKYQEKKVWITWQTGEELQNAGFWVERVNEKGELVPLGFVEKQASGFYQFPTEAYQFGENHYRLKQIDINGQFAYSEDIKVIVPFEMSSFQLTHIYPNPAKEQLFISLQMGTSQSLRIEMMDMMGKVVRKQRTELLSIGAQTLSLPLEHLEKGIYVIKITAKDGTEVMKKVVIGD
ncbi:MAG: glycoside hydrolase family 9 protein [Bacteroidia bacterium]